MYRQNNLTSKISKYIKINTSKMTRVISAFMLVFLVLGYPALAYTPQEQAQLNAIDQQNAAYKAQLDTLYSQQRTLANEIAIADAQANALQAQINDTQVRINITNNALTQTALEIKTAEEELAKQKINLGEFMKVMYMDGQTSQMELILTSNNFSDFVDKSEYMNTMQNKVQETMDKIAATKKELETKKLALETDKAKLDSLKEGQVSQISALNSQIYLKASLSAQNRSSQSDLQSKIAQNNANSYLIRCIASGACNSTANGDLQVVNQSLYYSQKMYGEYDTYDGSHSYYWDGCLITSLGMAHGLTPKQEAANHTFNGSGWMNTDATSGSVISWATANDILSHGGKVVMGLDIGHFVLAVGFNNGKYLINDPFFGTNQAYSKSQVVKLLRP